MAPPPGRGCLYKCAVCGDFVYESQLDYQWLRPQGGAASTSVRSAGISCTSHNWITNGSAPRAGLPLQVCGLRGFRVRVTIGLPMAPPPGRGCLYKCAVCGDFVYE